MAEIHVRHAIKNKSGTTAIEISIVPKLKRTIIPHTTVRNPKINAAIVNFFFIVTPSSYV
jgi:hypothetical protein